MPKSKFVLMENETYHELAKDLGNSLFIHFSRGDSGSGTFLCKTAEEFAGIKRNCPTKEAIISSRIHGISINMHAVVIDHKKSIDVIPSQPSIQLVGFKNLARRETIWTGNDFGAASDILKDETIGKLNDEITAIGKWMGSKGWRGLFGVDFVKNHNGEIYPVDINPRFQGSTQVLVEGCLKCGLPPLTMLHILQFLKCPISEQLIEKMRAQEIHPIKGALIVPHNLLQSRNRIKNFIKPGVYSIDVDGNLMFKRDGYKLSHCKLQSDILLTSGVPIQGLYIDVDCPILEVQTLSRIVDDSAINVNSLGKRIIKSVSSMIYQKEDIT